MNTKNREIFIIGIILIAVLAVYVHTVFPAYKNNDSPEIAASAYILGISHPPGYPLYNLAGKIAAFLPAGSIAFRVNMLSVMLSLPVLLLAFLVLKKTARLVFGREYEVISYISLVILAFSSVFWSQAIEAKGGIYILNMLFLLIMFILWLDLLEGFKPSKLYMLTFITAVALTNHWPSVVILTPVSLWFYFKNHGSISKKSLLIHLVLFLAGISAYVYLPFRGGTDGVFAFMAKPDTWENFWWTVLRSGYFTGTEAASNVMQNQILAWLKVTAVNYSFLSLFALPGIYAVYRLKQSVFFLLSAVYILTLSFVMAFNRAPKEIIWVIELFLLPALFVQYIFTAAGMIWILRSVKQQLYKNAVLAFLAATSAGLFFLHWKYNDNSRNFISYDFSDNIVRTVEKGGFYMGEGDIFTMFMPYEKYVRKRLAAIDYIPPFALQFKWGIESFEEKYGEMGLRVGQGGLNALQIIRRYSGEKDIYMTSVVDKLQENLAGEVQKVYGLVYKIAPPEERVPAGIFDAYIYRGIYDAVTDYDKLMISFYGRHIAEKAVDYYKMGEYRTAVLLGEKAVKMPGTDENAAAYFNLALSYHFIFDKVNELRCFKKVIKLDPKSGAAYEMAGRIYYNDSNYPMALGMFENALKYGSGNEASLRQFTDRIKSTDMSVQIQILYNKGVALLAEGDFAGAMDIFDYMIEKGYGKADVFQSIGIYYYKAGNFSSALTFFEKSLGEKKTSETYLYISYSLAQTDKKREALKKLEEGMKSFPGDNRLRQAYEMMNRQFKDN